MRGLTSAVDNFFNVRSLSDKQIAELSRETAIDIAVDIAVDLKGHTRDNRISALGEGCAPVQATYLGYPGTTGAQFIDYVIADEIVIPPNAQSNFTEKVVYLPHCYQANDSKRKISGKSFIREDLGLPKSSFVFCCFNNNYKILPATFDGWMRILNAVPHAILWLFEDNPTAAGNLRREAEARGIDSRRLIFAKWMPLDEHLARQRLADLFVDTFPYGAHTTASDALWAGLPVLTRMGESFASRVAASLLTAVDLPEPITHSQQEYEARAIDLALDPAKLAAVRRKLEFNRTSSPLFDGKRFARHLEAAFEKMHARATAGLEPDAIVVSES